MTTSNGYHLLPAIRGIQAGRQYVVATCHLGHLAELLPLRGETLSIDERKQRDINKARVRSLSAYVTDNPRNYVLPPLIASVDEPIEFVTFSDNPADYAMGTLKIPRSAKISIMDGQHRRMGLEQALNKNKDLAGESIPIVFFLDWGLKHSRQMFADLNRHAVRPARSLNILFDGGSICNNRHSGDRPGRRFSRVYQYGKVRRDR